MASLRSLALKLQTALIIQGRHISINQMQTYSERQERMVTKFVCNEKVNGKNKKLFESWQLADVVKFLAAELESGGGE